jgi:hypothetical protein
MGDDLPLDSCVRNQERELSPRAPRNAFSRQFQERCPACPFYLGAKR